MTRLSMGCAAGFRPTTTAGLARLPKTGAESSRTALRESESSGRPAPICHFMRDPDLRFLLSYYVPIWLFVTSAWSRPCLRSIPS